MHMFFRVQPERQQQLYLMNKISVPRPPCIVRLPPGDHQHLDVAIPAVTVEVRMVSVLDQEDLEAVLHDGLE